MIRRMNRTLKLQLYDHQVDDWYDQGLDLNDQNYHDDYFKDHEEDFRFKAFSYYQIFNHLPPSWNITCMLVVESSYSRIFGSTSKTSDFLIISVRWSDPSAWPRWSKWSAPPCRWSAVDQRMRGSGAERVDLICTGSLMAWLKSLEWSNLLMHLSHLDPLHSWNMHLISRSSGGSEDERNWSWTSWSYLHRITQGLLLMHHGPLDPIHSWNMHQR